MSRKILIGASPDHRKKSNLTRKDFIDAIIGKIFLSVTSSIMIFAFFNSFLTDIATPFPNWFINLVGVLICIIISIIIFTRKNKKTNKKNIPQVNNFDLYDSWDGSNSRNYYNPGSPYYQRDPSD